MHPRLGKRTPQGEILSYPELDCNGNTYQRPDVSYVPLIGDNTLFYVVPPGFQKPEDFDAMLLAEHQQSMLSNLLAAETVIGDEQDGEPAPDGGL